MPASSGLIHADGSYRLVALPGPGAVAVSASPRRSFAAAAPLDDRELNARFRDGIRHGDERGLFTIVGTRAGILSAKRYSAISMINPDDTVQSLPLNVELRSGVRLQGQLFDPDGRPLPGARVLGLANRELSEIIEGSFFEITELRPEEVREVLFIHKEKKLAKRLAVHGDETGPLQVRLDPCSTIAARVVDRNGQPIRHQMLVWEARGFPPDLELNCVFTDQNGCLEMPVVPRLEYRASTRLYFRGTAKKVPDVSLEPGQTQELGDLSTDATGGPPTK
jgi:hypothetical protein